jgi:hypothetical protein
MKTLRLFVLVLASFLTIVMLSACGSAPAESQPVDELVEEVSVPVVEPTMEPTPEPPSKRSPTPEIEPEIIDLGNDARLLLRGLPNDVILNANIDLEIKNDIPDSRNFDNVYSEVAVISLTKNGGPTTVDKGIVELCYTTTLTPGMNEQPVPFYWDTSNNPLLDGRPLRVSNVEKEPELVVCSMVETSGAYALIAR